MIRRSSRVRDVVGTAIMFFVLAAFTLLIIFGENLLENYKAH